MRSLACSLVLAAVAIGALAGSPSEAQAQRRWPGRAYAPSTSYNYVPNFNAYPWNYWAAIGAYGPYTPAFTGYGFYPPVYNYSYTLPSYQYYYGPGYSQFYYNPGSYNYWLR